MKYRQIKMVMCVMMTEISTIDGGQKDAFLRRANIKKIMMEAKKSGFQMVNSRWLPKTTSWTSMVSFQMPFINQPTLHLKSGHGQILDSLTVF